MQAPHDWQYPIRDLWARHRRWVPGAACAALLVSVAKGAQFAERHGWWFRGQYELLSLVVYVAWTGAVCIGIWMGVRAAVPKADRASVLRIVTAIFLAGVALKVGLRFVHLCAAGSQIIEWSAILGSPALVGAAMYGIRRRGLALLVAASLLAIVWMLARPYLDWAHGL